MRKLIPVSAVVMGVLHRVRGGDDVPGHRQADPRPPDRVVVGWSEAGSSPQVLNTPPVRAQHAADTMHDMSEQTVLVVDDEESIAEAVRARLENEGYRVVVAYDGPQAIDLHREHHPDLVVLDLMLPGHGRARGLQGASSATAGPRSSCSRRRPRRPTRWPASRWAPTTTSRSRSACASSRLA